MTDDSQEYGHERLVKDVEKLLENAKAYKFDNFKSDLATPKSQLVTELGKLMDNVKLGHYDQ